jgi:hypothetical protein
LHSHQSGDGSDTEMAPGCNTPILFPFLDLTFWERQKIRPF